MEFCATYHDFYEKYIHISGRAVDTNRQAAGLIPDDIIGIFQ
jgi:hypothetical protein